MKKTVFVSTLVTTTDDNPNNNPDDIPYDTSKKFPKTTLLTTQTITQR
jgi:hypothetical protein